LSFMNSIEGNEKLKKNAIYTASLIRDIASTGKLENER